MSAGETSWMEPQKIIERARASGRQAEAFDPDKLIILVEGILIDHGLHPDRGGHHKMAQTAASRLLRALGILPAGDDRYIDRRNAPDPESR